MATVTLSITIRAPLDRCFDLARSVDFHTHSMQGCRERAIGGRTSGLIDEGEEVTWEARHLGVRQRLTSRVTVCRSPTIFVDEQVRGPFRSLRHEHRFESIDAGETLLTDVFEFQAPFGTLGRAAESLFLTRYMRRLLEAHQARLKHALETDECRQFLDT